MRQLGKLEYKHDDRTLMLARYVDGATLPPTPSHFTLPHPPAAWPMFHNDQIGDCTCAAVGHMLEGWTSALGAEINVTDDQVIAAYRAVSGYDPSTGANDNGAVELDMLNFWRHTGVAGRRISAFASVDVATKGLLEAACWLFGGLYIGVALPAGAERMNGVWSLPTRHTGPAWEPGSWGGHAVNVIGYDRYGVTLITWGEKWRMTWGFWRAYVDEAWAIISNDWLTGGHTLAGFDAAQLAADLAAIKSQ